MWTVSLLAFFLLQAAPKPAPAPAGQTPVVLEPAPGNPVAVISTSMGDITVELFKDRAPVSVENFLRYATEGFYPGTIFHRVVKGFVVQGGGYSQGMVEKPTHEPIQNEATNGLRNTRGTLAMARTQTLRSATSQFYINVADNSALDHRGYSPSGLRLRRLWPGAERDGCRRRDRRCADEIRKPDRAGDDQGGDGQVTRIADLTGRGSRGFHSRDADHADGNVAAGCLIRVIRVP